MRFKNELCLVGFLALLMLGTTSLVIEGSQASTEQDDSYFNGDVKAPDIECIYTKSLWEMVE